MGDFRGGSVTARVNTLVAPPLEPPLKQTPAVCGFIISGYKYIKVTALAV